MELRIKGFIGRHNLVSPQNPNVIYWVGMSDAAAEAMEELITSKKIIPKPTSHLTYLHDGRCLDLPIQKKNYRYKTPHWMPLVFNADKGPTMQEMQEALNGLAETFFKPA